MINDDIDAMIQRGERTQELNGKYEGLNLNDLNNFKSDASVQQWEGGDFRPGVSFPPRSSPLFFWFFATSIVTTTLSSSREKLRFAVIVQTRADNQLFCRQLLRGPFMRQPVKDG